MPGEASISGAVGSRVMPGEASISMCHVGIGPSVFVLDSVVDPAVGRFIMINSRVTVRMSV